MSANWFYAQQPLSRATIESELRGSLWRAGFGNLWLSCTRDDLPYECQGIWEGRSFTLEWVPRDHLLLKASELDSTLARGIEHLVQHKALIAYKDAQGTVVVEWRAKRGAERLKDLRAGRVAELKL